MLIKKIMNQSQIHMLLVDIVNYKVALHSVVTFFANGFLRVTDGLCHKFDKCHGSWAGYGLDVTGYGRSGL